MHRGQQWRESSQPLVLGSLSIQDGTTVTGCFIPVLRAPDCVYDPQSLLRHGARPETSPRARRGASRSSHGRHAANSSPGECAPVRPSWAVSEEPACTRACVCPCVCVRLILCQTPSAPRSGKQLRRIIPNKATLFNPLLAAEHCSPDSEPPGLPAHSSFPYQGGPAAASPPGRKVGTKTWLPSALFLSRPAPPASRCAHTQHQGTAELRQEGEGLSPITTHWCALLLNPPLPTMISLQLPPGHVLLDPPWPGIAGCPTACKMGHELL